MQYQAPADLLKDKIILVTGAGDGIGKVAAKTFAAHGATVVLLGRTIHKLEDVYDEIVQAGSPEPAIYPLNLEGATPKDYEDLANTLDEQFGALHGLLHNAAFLGASTPIRQYDIDLWYKVMQVNLNAPFLLTQAVLPLMEKTPDSSILFTVDDKSSAYWGAYGISKDALVSFMKILSDEMNSDIVVKVNAIDPGPVRTPLRIKAFPGTNPNEMAQPDSIMNSYLYLMGTDNYDTGKIFKAQD
ncbi:MAG: YciK family oxidoreductase [Gammaproteobacteria bacterium]|nr:YciK family oxidoreductase [Gammaproteobacteria bacterium]